MTRDELVAEIAADRTGERLAYVLSDIAEALEGMPFEQPVLHALVSVNIIRDKVLPPSEDDAPFGFGEGDDVTPN